MTRTDLPTLAASILDKVGGADNVASAAHCATRLRLQLHDESRADADAVEKLPGVLTVMRAGGQFQVVIGTNVADVYAAFTPLLGQDHDASTATAPAKPTPRPRTIGQFFGSALEVIAALLSPMLWTLAGAGLLKAFVSAADQFNWLETTSSTYKILDATSNSLFYFLPIILAVTAARRFRADEFTAMAIGGALVYPSVVELASAKGDVDFFGIPVATFNYTSSLIPIIIAVWVQGHLERWLRRWVPEVVKNFAVPMIVLIVMVPLVLLTIGPIASHLSDWISSGISSAFDAVPWLAGALMGGLWQFFVLFGLHWAFLPIIAGEVTSNKFSLLGGPLLPAVLAQAAATFAVFLRTRSAKRRAVAGPATFSGFLAGITEPAIYGVNLPLRLPFAFGMLGGAVGGAIVASGGTAVSSLVLPSLLAITGFTAVGNIVTLIIGTVTAVAVAFVLTFIFVDRERPDPESTEADLDGSGQADTDAADTDHHDSVALSPRVSQTTPLTVEAPVAGTTVAMADLPDRVFASGALGPGLAVTPEDGRILSPVDGTVVVATNTGHAFGLTTADGVEVLVHAGIDTVRLGGSGFTALVQRGDTVHAGDPLVDVDLDVVRAAGYDTSVIVAITNSARLGTVEPAPPGVHLEAGDPLLRVAAASIDEEINA
ncbi:beta-glucoside-specific PTS transporter subunit IIABC [Williamsia sp. CHRR-6]|uniref:beta-glucoside-specific PTS transporter subunit IIABC n=1 Tax=Williamsia sp. CHRR-6 TaxID=2835871 RepID=UPI001BD96D3E|nr:beta-glucoside-specific PTS transporter subunit IIABC [Williamsia sp. CHRR-6]MBT0565871.1 beta-glucoside-specific PTS transporter subunit IIABC [Williamsia sp. CHRR-6]